VLHLTSAALSEDTAERLGAIRRIGEPLDHFPDGVAPLYLRDADARAFLRQRAEAKNGHFIGASDALPVAQQIREEKLDFGAHAERG
jgi:hypothetical protein